jgi:hypothetical protein
MRSKLYSAHRKAEGADRAQLMSLQLAVDQGVTSPLRYGSLLH